jgi:hypothetical protein
MARFFPGANLAGYFLPFSTSIATECENIESIPDYAAPVLSDNTIHAHQMNKILIQTLTYNTITTSTALINKLAHDISSAT